VAKQCCAARAAGVQDASAGSHVVRRYGDIRGNSAMLAVLAIRAVMLRNIIVREEREGRLATHYSGARMSRQGAPLMSTLRERANGSWMEEMMRRNEGVDIYTSVGRGGIVARAGAAWHGRQEDAARRDVMSATTMLHERGRRGGNMARRETASRRW